ncbi:fatty acid-binding [Pyrenophora seminiperda CCB06]|uniref:Fatty acid-binding n=1 Tax=Pyrenophora seminiperda CCB06 TaxID=1302712 RepID=A0A3M7LYS2_9PLEO|nr:fatty acid-binding [Pyrenophora seminiperda CCB06]
MLQRIASNIDVDAFPSSAAFDEISRSLSSEADRKDAIKQAKAIFAFTLKNNGAQETWYIDLKETGTVGKGAGPNGKADVTLTMNDADFGKLVSGQANAQKMFMSGKLKVKGDIMRATKIEAIIKKTQIKSKL